MEKQKELNFDAVVIGAGHAGCEAALALARTNQKTALITLQKEGVAFLACNPSIGGTAKGHLVCEVDALGGQMGINADKTTLQLRMLNMGKGPAVHSLRAQVDKHAYHNNMLSTLETQENLTLIEDEAIDIGTKNGAVCYVKTKSGTKINTRAVVITAGVYLNSRTIIGEEIKDSGPSGFKNAKGLTKSLEKLGYEIRRFKTGTPPRLEKDSINYSKFTVQKGDRNIQTFSFLTKRANKNTHVCYLGYTNEKTKQIILDNLDKAPLYSGVIVGTGPRYCPSIETKIVRFSDKDRHQIFLEPESASSNEIYLQGMSTSMPKDIQEKMTKSIEGLEQSKIVRYGYAIEYDCINPLGIYATLESKKVKGLFTAGQINGTSGYEEAAAQGILAGINASLFLRGKPQIILSRDSSYIGVLVDDLTVKGTIEPYRMMTSRAEYRLLLRQDNVDKRLTQIGRDVGLVGNERYEAYLKKMKNIEKIKSQVHKHLKPSSELNNYLASIGESPAPSGISIDQLVKRSKVEPLDLKRKLKLFKNFKNAEINEALIEIKYEGYLLRQNQLIEKERKLEEKKIPLNFDYNSVAGLRTEARQKLAEFKPLTVGEASRISGVNPADITILIMNLNKKI